MLCGSCAALESAPFVVPDDEEENGEYREDAEGADDGEQDGAPGGARGVVGFAGAPAAAEEGVLVGGWWGAGGELGEGVEERWHCERDGRECG